MSMATFSNIAFPVIAQQVISPYIYNENFVFLENKEGTKALDIDLNVNQTDRNLDLSFHNNNFPLPVLGADETYFVVVYDSAHKTPILYNYLLKNSQNFYKCSFKIPYYCDVVDLHFYKQKISDPDYTMKEENFIGKVQNYLADSVNFFRGTKTKLTILDKNGNITTSKTAHFISSLIPNYYTITIPTITFRKKVGRIILPCGQENLMSLDEKIVPCNYFRTLLTPGTTDNWTDHGDGFNFYLPKGVTEFKFQVFNVQPTDNVNDILYQFDVKLNRLN